MRQRAEIRRLNKEAKIRDKGFDSGVYYERYLSLRIRLYDLLPGGIASRIVYGVHYNKEEFLASMKESKPISLLDAIKMWWRS